ncbi:MAG: ComF family protein [Planctomycetota bacterium]|jgi:ComF family protein
MSAIVKAMKAEWLNPLIDAIYPPKCRLCGGLTGNDLACEEHALPNGLTGPRCDRCAANLPPAIKAETRCAACRRKRPNFRRVVALGDYEQGALREWLLALKHGHRKDLAIPLGAYLGELLMRSGGTSEDILVPVPLHPMRRYERGYDQARALAEATARAAGLDVEPVLKRTRATVPQGTAGAVSRASNVRSAFAIKSGANIRIANRRVWLLDDVLTSGATAGECTRELRRCGAETVGVLVVARAGESKVEPTGG